MARHEELLALIRPGVTQAGGVWADFGAGAGAFTRALAELLGPEATIYAVDRDPRGLRDAPGATARGARIVVVQADFTRALKLPPLDGALMANALHYARDQVRTLFNLSRLLRPGGRLLLVEYDGRGVSFAVPYPVPPDRFVRLCREAGLDAPTLIGTRASRFGGTMYAALTTSFSEDT